MIKIASAVWVGFLLFRWWKGRRKECPHGWFVQQPGKRQPGDCGVCK